MKKEGSQGRSREKGAEKVFRNRGKEAYFQRSLKRLEPYRPPMRVGVAGKWEGRKTPHSRELVCRCNAKAKIRNGMSKSDHPLVSCVTVAEC